MSVKNASRMIVVVSASLLAPLAALRAVAGQAPNAVHGVPVNPERDAYYGDLHLHTSYSLDAYLQGETNVDPDGAYRFARGEVVDYFGQPVRRREPLDFMAVTDHSEMMGVLNNLNDPEFQAARKAAIDARGSRDYDKRIDQLWGTKRGPAAAVLKFHGKSAAKRSDGGVSLPDTFRSELHSAWQREIEFANRNYEPGKFTTFIAYEWSATPGFVNLHRNVIFKGNTAPYPFTALDSQTPEDLWAWLEMIRKQGYEALAIPHNGNASNGLMYDWVDSSGKPIDRAYAKERQLNEPLSEISQIKGSSETHPLLSPHDEFADYEIYDFIAAYQHRESRSQGSYLRDALSRGLVLRRQLGVNPFKYGFVGASDLHTGLSVSAQADYNGYGGRPPTQAEAQSILGETSGITIAPRTTSGNLTGVWAESNTRESIYGALRRRETFATSGSRLKFRFFGGWDLGEKLLQEKNWIAIAYAKGVPMGGDLPARPSNAKAPSFAIWAVKDPNGATLDQVQVIKVWEENGQQREKVFDVAWGGHRRPDAKTGKLPAVGDTVDLKTGQYANTLGASELKTVWTDPEFNPHHLAAYYLRVLEIPTPRWSTLLAIRYGLPLPKEVPSIEQQRGWSSPVWYTPATQ